MSSSAFKKLIGQFIFEQLQISDEDAEAPKGAELGRIAFAPVRKTKPYEKNTDIEEQLFNALKNHYDSNWKLSSEQCQLLQKILANGWYSDIIKEPKDDIVYRGMNVDEKWLRTVLDLNDAEETPGEGIEEIFFTFVPDTRRRQAASSWTQDKNTAEYFSTYQSAMQPDTHYKIVLYAKVVDNPNMFVVGENGLYDVEYLGDNSDEHEVIGLGSIKVFKIEWEWFANDDY